MSNRELTVDEILIDGDDPQATLVLREDDQELFRKPILVLSEDDIIAASNDLVSFGIGASDADQALAEMIGPIRIQWIRKREASAKAAAQTAPREVAEEGEQPQQQEEEQRQQAV